MSEEMTLRGSIEAQVNLWRHVAEGEPDADGLDGDERTVYAECAGDLAALLAAHPASGPAKVIIVECEGKPARLFAATGWEVLTSGQDAGDLVLVVDGDEWVAQIGARNWDTVYVESAQVAAAAPAAHAGDPAGSSHWRNARKLAIALTALEAIKDEPHAGYGPQRAGEALGKIYALGVPLDELLPGETDPGPAEAGEASDHDGGQQ